MLMGIGLVSTLAASITADLVDQEGGAHGARPDRRRMTAFGRHGALAGAREVSFRVRRPDLEEVIAEA
jgi:hypothetical protein